MLIEFASKDNIYFGFFPDQKTIIIIFGKFFSPALAGSYDKFCLMCLSC